MRLNKTLNALKTSAQYITHDDMTVVYTIKRHAIGECPMCTRSTTVHLDTTL